MKDFEVNAKRTRAPEAIKAELQQFYERMAKANGQTALTSTHERATPNERYGNAFYPDEALDGLPQSIVAGSIACGNPHAIAALQPGEVVLDLGCGGGLDVLLAARQVAPTGFVYGVDMTAEMVELARRNAATVGVTHVEFRQGEIESLPLSDHVVDVVMANCVINLSPEQSVALAEAYRVLKPGGRLTFAEVMVDGDLSVYPLSEEDVQTAMNCAGCIFGALTITAFTHLLEEAGFTEIEVIIQHRHTPEELLGRLPAALQSRLHALDPSVVRELIGCFTSSAIRARKMAC